jgi:hypothetical protein
MYAQQRRANFIQSFLNVDNRSDNRSPANGNRAGISHRRDLCVVPRVLQISPATSLSAGTVHDRSRLLSRKISFDRS